jgi:hypothetical protein
MVGIRATSRARRTGEGDLQQRGVTADSGEGGSIEG